MTPIPYAPIPYAKLVLLAAAVYNLIWGAVVVLLPVTTLAWLGLDDVNYPQLWQCVGMIVGVYGIGYGIAAYDAVRHWPIVLVGFLGKLFGPVGTIGAIIEGVFPPSFLWVNLTNDLIWLPFFAFFLYRAWQIERRPKVLR